MQISYLGTLEDKSSITHRFTQMLNAPYHNN